MPELLPHDQTVENFPVIKQYALANEALNDPVTRRDYFEHMDEDGFIDEAQRIASMIRTGDSSSMQIFDAEEGMQLMSLDTPDHRDNETLLRQTWQVARQILHDRNLSDEDALMYAGLTTGSGILLVHPFADGNGRTSRVFSYLLARGTVAVDELEMIIRKSEAWSGWSITPMSDIVQQYPWDDDQYNLEAPVGSMVLDMQERSKVVREYLAASTKQFLSGMQDTQKRPLAGFPATLTQEQGREEYALRAHRYSQQTRALLESPESRATVREQHRIVHEGFSDVYGPLERPGRK